MWVILGLCWVCSLTKKTVAGCESLERRGKEITKNVKRMNILLNKCVE